MRKTVLTAVVFLLFTVHGFAQCWSQIAAGESHTLAIKTDGTLWAWGLNDKGQLGDGTTIDKNIPTQVGTDTDWAIVDAIGYNSSAIKTNGTLWSWGNNLTGQIGDGNHGSGVINTTPTQVGTDSDWVKVATARAFAIKSNGTLWGWGENADGRLGTGDLNPHYIPVQIGTDSDWTDVSAGGNQTLALKTNHTIWGWGLNKNGSLGIGAVNNFVLIPTQTGNNTADWQKIDVGGCCSSKMIKTDGTLWAMGSNGQGNVGNSSNIDVNIPTQIGIDVNWTFISNSFHSCAIQSDNSLWVWGLNSIGQLGDGTLINKNTPLEIAGNIQWVKVVTGTAHTIAISTNNNLYTWGWNNYGQLGDGTFTDKNTPSQIGSNCILGTKIFNPKNTLKVFPNPATNTLMLSYDSENNGDIEISVNNELGQLLYQKNENIIKGENQTPINLSTYASEIYLLTLKSESQSVSVKVIKQ